MPRTKGACRLTAGQAFLQSDRQPLKYAGHVTKIRTSYEKSDGHLNLIYEDNGTGISAETKHGLFAEGFTTGKGSGYGLFLIRKLMEAYGWTIQETGAQEMEHDLSSQFLD